MTLENILNTMKSEKVICVHSMDDETKMNMNMTNFTVVITWCKCGHNNMQHEGTISEDFKLSKKVLCTVCDCEDFEEGNYEPPS